MKEQQFKSIDVNKILFWVAIAFLLWQINRGWKKSTETVYSQNAGSDLETQQAIQLRQGMNPSGSGFLIGDGTDEAAIMETAGNITDYAKVFQSYKVLYGSDLTADLTSELNREELAQFLAIVNAKKASTTAPGTSTNPAKPAAPAAPIGKTVTAITTANIRIDKAPYAVLTNAFGQNKQATKGQVLGIYIAEKMIPDVPNKGNRNVFVRYSAKSLGGLITEYSWIVKTAVTIK